MMKENNKIKCIIDTDPGIDDMQAIVWVIKSQKFDIKLIVSCLGNSTIDEVTKNCLIGNVTEYGEFNAHGDPLAIDYVYSLDIPTTIVPIEIGSTVLKYSSKEYLQVKEAGEIGTFFYDAYLWNMKRFDAIEHHDQAVTAYLLNDKIFKTVKFDYVNTVLDGEKKGQTIFKENPKGKINMIVDANKEAFFKELLNISSDKKAYYEIEKEMNF